RLVGDYRLSGNLRIEQLKFGVEAILLKKTCVTNDPNRCESAARLRIGHGYVSFLRLTADFRCPCRGRYQNHHADDPSQPLFWFYPCPSLHEVLPSPACPDVVVKPAAAGRASTIFNSTTEVPFHS